MIRRSSGDRANRRLDKLEAEVKRAAIKSTQAAHDAETVRLVREWAERSHADTIGLHGLPLQVRHQCASEALAILNRKPAATKGGKRGRS